MNLSHLNRYRRLFRTAERMGAATILREHIGLGEKDVIPLSISHGVDFGSWREPIDIRRIEPIHWSYNQELHERARKIKNSLLLPHPWAIKCATENQENRNGKGTLIIGPPPSRKNDESLYSLLSSEISSNWSILVKYRGNESESARFWNERGVKTVTAGIGDNDFYHRLYDVLSGYETIIGCTFSSALVFAASVGKSVQILSDYFYNVYTDPDFTGQFNSESTSANAIVSTFVNGNRNDVTQLARKLLGFDLVHQKDKMHEDYCDMIQATPNLFFPAYSTQLQSRLIAEIALIFDRPGIIRASPKILYQELVNKRVVAQRINEISVLIDGPSGKNLEQRSVKYVKGVTRGGFGF